MLIVEDNVELANYIASLLESICETRIGCDGEEGLELVRRWAPDLVLSDVMMPRRDGLSLCRELKSRPETATVPVILLTALTHREALLRGWEAGATNTFSSLSIPPSYARACTPSCARPWDDAGLKPRSSS